MDCRVVSNSSNYENSRYKHLSSLRLSLILGAVNLGLELAFSPFFCPSLLLWQPKRGLDLLQISMLFQFKIQGGGFSPSPSSFRLLHKRWTWGCMWDFVLVARGNVSLSAHPWNVGALSLVNFPVPNFLVSTEQRPMGKSLWWVQIPLASALPIMLRYPASPPWPLRIY